jgi:hypothetical protein
MYFRSLREARPRQQVAREARPVAASRSSQQTQQRPAREQQGIKLDGIEIPKIFRRPEAVLEGALCARRFAPTSSRVGQH